MYIYICVCVYYDHCWAKRSSEGVQSFMAVTSLSLSLSLSVHKGNQAQQCLWCVHIYIYICVCVCVYIYIYIYIFMFLSMRIIDMCSQDAGVDVLLFKRGFNTSQNLE